MMKTSKNYCDRNVSSAQHPSGRLSIQSKSSATSKKRQDKHNKQNFIQITQHFEPHPQTYPSKQFIHSRDSFSKNSRQILKQVNLNQPITPVQHSKECPRTINQERQQQLFDRRLSLKCTTNFSQQLQHQKSHRLSIAPTRKDSLIIHSNGPQYILDQRQSIYSASQNSTYGHQMRGRPDYKKEAIINNFVHKLDKEQDLRSIIQSKLRSGQSTSQILIKDRKNQSFFTDYCEDSPNTHMLSSKLKNCENEIKYFKSIIRQLETKIVELSHGNDSKKLKKKGSQHEQLGNSREVVADFLGMIKKKGKNPQTCMCDHSKRKQSKEIGIQTGVEQSFTNNRMSSQKVNESFDFFQNLEKTLKVLDGKKK